MLSLIFSLRPESGREGFNKDFSDYYILVVKIDAPTVSSN